MEKVSEAKLSDLLAEFGIKKNIQDHDKIKAISKMQRMREEHTEHLLEKKDESRFDQMRDDKKNDRSSGGGQKH